MPGPPLPTGAPCHALNMEANPPGRGLKECRDPQSQAHGPCWGEGTSAEGPGWADEGQTAPGNSCGAPGFPYTLPSWVPPVEPRLPVDADGLLGGLLQVPEPHGHGQVHAGGPPEARKKRQKDEAAHQVPPPLPPGGKGGSPPPGSLTLLGAPRGLPTLGRNASRDRRAASQRV